MNNKELKENYELMVKYAQEKYPKEMDGCSFLYGTAANKMIDWIGNSGPIAFDLEEYFENVYPTIVQAIRDHWLCFNVRVVIELLDIAELDKHIRDVLDV